MNTEVRIVAQGCLVEGNAGSLPALYAHLAQAGIQAERNPDVYVREYRAFGIGDARELRDRANTRAIAGGARVFVVVAPTMTADAQNALLKTLEEPPAGALFFLITPSPQTLIPTLLSRMQMLSLERSPDSELVSVAQFLSAKPEKRIDMLKPLYTHAESDERDVRGAILFLRALEKTLAPRAREATVREGLTAIYRARTYLADKGALLKPLLEQVALLVP